MPEIIIALLKFLGITSAIGLIGLYLAFLGLLPEIVVEGVIDKSKRFNSESRLKIKNNGRLTAHSVRADAHNINAKIGGLQMVDCAVVDCGPPVASKLSSGEATEMTIRPGIEAKGNFEQFAYDLTLKYCAKLLIFKKSFNKKWRVELKNYPDGYSWEITII